jgi:N-acetylneuraminate 9-O-acetyltransferase
MMFRMCFLVTILVLTQQNDFMLYYICALHCYWFCAVYVCMGIREGESSGRSERRENGEC